MILITGVSDVRGAVTPEIAPAVKEAVVFAKARIGLTENVLGA